MKSYDYDAATYDSDIYCVECLPDVFEPEAIDSGDVHPIFADSEWDYVPTCCVCGAEHDYVILLTEEEKGDEDES